MNREAGDLLPARAERRDTAIVSILAADPVPVPEIPAELRVEFDEAHLSLTEHNDDKER